MRTFSSLALALGTITLFTAGCSVDLGRSTDGKDGRAQFQYGGLDCLFGCAIDQPMMHGTTETILVRAKSGDLPVLAAKSTDPSVAITSTEVQCCKHDSSSATCRGGVDLKSCNADEQASLTIVVAAATAGSADLVLTQSDGTEWDRATVTVAEPARLAVTCASGSVAVGTECVVGWKAYDAQGTELKTDTGVKLMVAPQNVAAFHHFILADTWSEDGDQSLLGPTVIGLTAGDAQITAVAGQATSTLTVHVTAKP
jgi:hypothetical protein